VKLLDANILLYAYDSSSPHHAVCKDWLELALNDDEPVGLPWQTIFAFVRISTNPRAVLRPLPTQDACGIISTLLERPTIVVVEPGDEFWRTFEQLVADARVSGPLIADAVLAALAIEQGAVICSTDRDFLRFRGISVIDPTQAR
jgi:toxin-antitoxin system PIN domain toxin